MNPPVFVGPILGSLLAESVGVWIDDAEAGTDPEGAGTAVTLGCAAAVALALGALGADATPVATDVDDAVPDAASGFATTAQRG